jgi:hypothetical protein
VLGPGPVEGMQATAVADEGVGALGHIPELAPACGGSSPAECRTGHRPERLARVDKLGHWFEPIPPTELGSAQTAGMRAQPVNSAFCSGAPHPREAPELAMLVQGSIRSTSPVPIEML